MKTRLLILTLAVQGVMFTQTANAYADKIYTDKKGQTSEHSIKDHHKMRNTFDKIKDKRDGSIGHTKTFMNSKLVKK